MTVSRKVGVWGVTWGSAVVLSAGALFPPDPCRASLRIVNASGRVVARHAAVVRPCPSPSRQIPREQRILPA